MEFSLAVERSSDVATIAVAGEVDLNNASKLRDALVGLAAEVSRIVVDCTDLEFLDSTGLSALLAGQRAVGEAGGSLEIVSAPPMLLKMIKIVGLEDVLSVKPA